MSCNYHGLPHSGIQSLNPYVPGKSIEELAKEQGLIDIIKLASNENPLGCSPLAKQALAELTGMQIATYPTPANHPLRQKLSKHWGIDPDMLTLSNGSDLLFSVLLTTFALHNDKHMLTHDHAFISYQIQAQTLGIPVRSIGLKSNWEVDIDAIIAACNQQTALIFIANPNNPTGLFINPDSIQKLLNNIPATTILVLDEAYYEYAYPEGDKTSINLLQHHPNLVITRTFSKAYGLAGLRLGYAIANLEIAELLQRVQIPFAVNQAALAAAYEAIDDQHFLRQTVELNALGREQIRQGLKDLKLTALPSSCNFITFDCGTSALPIYQGLLRKGVIVRPLAPYNLFNHLRVSIGNSLQNTRFLDTLAICLSENKKEPGHEN
ncbi:MULTISPECIES: histidinol-phosphate transaminase [unclassified Legionella]|uniref:histidinol-phosphate transaminase n=1 Tax=unclassified Legionella TaxID=2622702 RepID=UPI001E3BCB03|nr:histidinol-phosphate transaminase [Legionella sp. 31fI33]MCC5013916.1 histidinol-phosphate transaminase [Legionella sp. 31fI33]